MDIKLQMISLCVESSWKKNIVEFCHCIGLLQFRLVRWILDIKTEELAKRVKTFAEGKLKQDQIPSYKVNFSDLLNKDWKVHEAGQWVSFAFPDKNKAVHPHKKNEGVSTKKIAPPKIIKNQPKQIPKISADKKTNNIGIIIEEKPKIVLNETSLPTPPLASLIETHEEVITPLHETSKNSSGAVVPIVQETSSMDSKNMGESASRTNDVFSQTLPSINQSNFSSIDKVDSKIKGPKIPPEDRPQRPVMFDNLSLTPGMPQRPMMPENLPVTPGRPQRPVLPDNMSLTPGLPQRPVLPDNLPVTPGLPQRPVLPDNLPVTPGLPQRPVLPDNLPVTSGIPQRPVRPAPEMPDHLIRPDNLAITAEMPQRLGIQDSLYVYQDEPFGQMQSKTIPEIQGSETTINPTEPKRISNLFSKVFRWGRNSLPEKFDKVEIKPEALSEDLKALDKALQHECSIHTWPLYSTEIEQFTKKIHPDLDFFDCVFVIKERHPEIFRHHKKLFSRLEPYFDKKRFDEISHKYFHALKEKRFHQHCNEYYSVLATLEGTGQIAAFLAQVNLFKSNLEKTIADLTTKKNIKTFPPSFIENCDAYLLSYNRLLNDIHEMVAVIPVLKPLGSHKISISEQQKLAPVIQELLETEINYLQILKILIDFREFFFKNLPEMDKDDLKFLETYFNTLQKMHDLSQVLINDIQHLKHENLEQVLKIFLTKKFLEIYQDIVDYERALKIIGNIKDHDKLFNKFKQELKSSKKIEMNAFIENTLRQSIDGFLINTVQRLPRYDLFFSQAHKIIHPHDKMDHPSPLALALKVTKNYIYNLGQVMNQK